MGVQAYLSHGLLHLNYKAKPNLKTGEGAKRKELQVETPKSHFLARRYFKNGMKEATLQEGLVFGLNSTSEGYHWDC